MDTKRTIMAILFLFLLCACSGSSGGGGGAPAVTEMQVGVTESATIEAEGDVDTYHLRVAETNRFLNIRCSESASGSGVDLMVTVYEQNADGTRVRLFGKHKPVAATPAANLAMDIYIDRPKDLYIEVRDLMDDDAAPNVAYRLTCGFNGASEENHDFSSARRLSVDGNDLLYDAIASVGEIDCFTFSPATAGVFQVTVDHLTDAYMTSAVQLSMILYNRSGDRLQAVRAPDDTLLAYLDPVDGPYYVAVSDSDNMHMDAAAVYTVLVSAVDAPEAMADDTAATAGSPVEAGGVMTAEGAVSYGASSASDGYAADVDWYRFFVDPGTVDAQAVRITIAGAAGGGAAATLRADVYDGAMEKITSHDFSGADPFYENRFRTTGGVHYLSVTTITPGKLAAGAGYRIDLDVADLEDDMNNTENGAVVLASGVPVEDAVGYRADTDWFRLNVDTAAPGILSVDLIGEASIIDYQVSVWRGAEMVQRVSDLSGAADAAHLKTAIWVPADLLGTADYHIKVCDAQNDEGTDVPYTLTATYVSVPGTVPDIPAMGPSDVLRYYNEADEQLQAQGTYVPVEIEIFSGNQPVFLANTDWLDFRADTLPEGVTVDENPDGTTTIGFPWIAGYVDYQGDRDLFQVDLGQLLPGGEDADWYYDVRIRLVVPDPGSVVEYVWKLYRDRNRNQVIMDDPTSPDGYKACAGDDTPGVVAGIDSTVPTGDQSFWIGSQWGADALFYLGIGDFNYQRLPGGDPLEENPEPDDDWGYDAPYYLQCELTYHPGTPWPD